MFQELKFQLSSAILTVVTIAAVVAGILNYDQNRRFPLPDDGVTWIDAESSSGPVVEAYQVATDSGANHAWIHKGDEVLAINGYRLKNSLDVARILAGVGAWGSATYTIRRDGVEFPVKVIIGQAPRSRALFFQYPVGLAYLVIGLFIYFRRNSAYKARHFFVFCLASYIFFCFHYTGKLNTLDRKST